jgi:hypothetical protein
VVAPASLGSIKSQTGRDACIFPVLLHALECPQDLATQFLGGAYGVSVSAYVYVSTFVVRFLEKYLKSHHIKTLTINVM